MRLLVALLLFVTVESQSGILCSSINCNDITTNTSTIITISVSIVALILIIIIVSFLIVIIVKRCRKFNPGK